MNSGQDALRDLLNEADRTAPRQSIAPVSLATLQRRAQRRQAWRAVAALAIVLAAWGFWHGTHQAFSGASDQNTPDAMAGPDTVSMVATARTLQTNAQALLQKLIAMRGQAKLREPGLQPGRDTARLAIERAAMASFAYWSQKQQSNEPSGFAHLARLREQLPSTQGGRESARLLNSR